MKEQKKGAGPLKPTPSHEQLNYSRLIRLCLVIFFIGLAICLVGYCLKREDVQYLGIGMFFSTGIVLCGSQPIKEDVDDE